VDVVDFYDRWVNGKGLRLTDLVTGRMPRVPPAIPSNHAASEALSTHLVLHRYESKPVALPSLDKCDLAPIQHVLVHGSMATNDATSFSDIDIAVVVDDISQYAVQQHRAAIKALRQLLRAMFHYDPLMHHGFMFFPASGLEKYDQRFLPIETLRCARVLYGSSELRLREKPAPYEFFTRSLRSSAGSLGRRIERQDFLVDDYQLKAVLSGILLMPARVLAVKGVHLYKRDSFEAARELFTAKQWEFIVRAEAHRALWLRPPLPLFNRYVYERGHPRLRQAIGERMAPRLNVRRFSKRMIEGLTESARDFLDAVQHTR
jgi:hypothetical protein